MTESVHTFPAQITTGEYEYTVTQSGTLILTPVEGTSNPTEYKDVGIFITSPIDIGDSFTRIDKVVVQSIELAENVAVEFTSSSNLLDWEDWESDITKLKAHRYLKIKLTLKANEQHFNRTLLEFKDKSSVSYDSGYVVIESDKVKLKTDFTYEAIDRNLNRVHSMKFNLNDFKEIQELEISLK